jgi:ubiquitin carboxyl-terminal hydrolase 10
VRIEALPPVLVLHLKRFLYDATADGIVKISKPIRFAPELEIPLGTILYFPAQLRLRITRDSDDSEIMAPIAAEPAHYKLYGVLYHYGESAGSGHYTVDVLHPNGDSGDREAWLRIDNEAVSAVHHEDVFGGQDHEWADDRSAHMLFYCRMLPHGHDE